MVADLHTHSRFSDGTDSPQQLLDGALAAGLTALAVTDHDTMAGWPELVAVRPPQLTLIPGAELSTHVVAGERVISVHLLAYLFDPDFEPLARELERLRQDRLQRGLTIVDRMVADKVGISRQQVLEIAAGAPVGRPHIARALINIGLVGSIAEAFSSYLAANSRYYVAKSDTPLLHAIELVRQAGGVPVIAHAGSRGAGRISSWEFFASAQRAGLAGIEVRHPDHDPATRARLANIAQDLGLFTTGSSDYHGENKLLTLGQEQTSATTLDTLLSVSDSGMTPIGPGW